MLNLSLGDVMFVSIKNYDNHSSSSYSSPFSSLVVEQCPYSRLAELICLCLHIDFQDEKRYVLVSASLIIILFTLLFLGGGTMPLLKVSRAHLSLPAP